jgi:hypothetical protein
MMAVEERKGGIKNVLDGGYLTFIIWKKLHERLTSLSYLSAR